jgi:uncharacterized protein
MAITLTRSLRVAAILAVLLAAGCAGHAGRTTDARQALDRHDAKQALTLYNEELKVSGNELPAEVSGDNAVLLLDRSVIFQQLDQYQQSSRDLEIADKQVEMLDFSRSTAHEIGRYLYSDSVGPYKARPYEKLLVNTLNIANYLAQGNLSGAKIEARRLAVMQKYLSESEKDDPTAQLLGPGSYLAGFTFERAGDLPEAVRYYDEALKASAYDSLVKPLYKLVGGNKHSSSRITELLTSSPTDLSSTEKGDADHADLLVVVNYGRVPSLQAKRVPVGLALTEASMFLADGQESTARKIAAEGLVTWVSYPVLEPSPNEYGPPRIEVDKTRAEVEITRVDDLVREAYAKQTGPIIASAITRMIARAAVGGGVTAVTKKASGNGMLAAVLALGTQAALVAADVPDTRCWATLPARIAIARLRVPAGEHTVRMMANGAMREHKVKLDAKGFAVVNLTELSRVR